MTLRSVLAGVGWVVTLAYPPVLVGQQVAAAPSASAPAPDSAREWLLRVPLDSGEVHVAVSTRAASVTVIAPSGTFVQVFETAEPLAAWADVAVALPAPQPVSPGPATPADAPAQLRYASVRSAPPSDTARRFDLTEYQLTRVEGDSAPAYVLSGTNGAWDFALRLQPAQAAALLAALRGERAPGAVPYGYPRTGRTPAENIPEVTGAWLGVQVDREVRLGAQPPAPAYPGVLRGDGALGSVQLSFIVDETGRVRPSSVRLIGKAHPAFAAAARDAVLAARYTPAERGGRAVPQLTMQGFNFQP